MPAIWRRLGRLLIGIAPASLFLGGATIAPAAVVQTTGAVAIATPPADVSSNKWESNTVIRVFDERQSLFVTQSQALDIVNPGTSPGNGGQNLSPGTVAAGWTVNATSMHFDVNGTRATTDPIELTGSVTFDRDIIGLMVLSDTQNSSNATFGLPGTTYSSGPDHGLEIDTSGTMGRPGSDDTITLSSDRRTVTVDLQDASFADDVRIITVPEPGGLGIAILGMTSLLGRRRR